MFYVFIYIYGICICIVHEFKDFIFVKQMLLLFAVSSFLKSIQTLWMSKSHVLH